MPGRRTLSHYSLPVHALGIGGARWSLRSRDSYNIILYMIVYFQVIRRQRHAHTRKKDNNDRCKLARALTISIIVLVLGAAADGARPDLKRSGSKPRF